jgi:hypothetical protein
VSEAAVPEQPQTPRRAPEEAVIAIGVVAAFAVFFVVAFILLVSGVYFGWISRGP